jgi:putative endonuclease
MREEAGGWAYIMASKPYGTLYAGSTRDLQRRVHERREGVIPGFTRKYGVTRPVWCEAHESVASAHGRETRLKRWRRAWKIELIEVRNPHWEDLYPELAKFG